MFFYSPSPVILASLSVIEEVLTRPDFSTYVANSGGTVLFSTSAEENREPSEEDKKVNGSLESEFPPDFQDFLRE